MSVMKRTLLLITMALGCSIGWGADWLTDGHDPQRTGWQKDEKLLTVANVGKMKLLCKLNSYRLKAGRIDDD
jgi:hypothetical protein